MITRLTVLGLILLALAAGIWKLWHTADKAGYERSQREYQAAAERQRESNRGAAHKAESTESIRTVYRTRVVTKIVKEIQDATAPLATCAVPSVAVRMLNDAAKCAREGGPATCASDFSLPGAR